MVFLGREMPIAVILCVKRLGADIISYRKRFPHAAEAGIDDPLWSCSTLRHLPSSGLIKPQY